MAEQHAVSDEGHADMDYAEHEKTYRMFIGMAKWGTASVILILIILAFMTL
jgi:hypothetical protein